MTDHIPDTGNKVSQLTTPLAQIAAAGGPKPSEDYNFKRGCVWIEGQGWVRCSKACEDGVIAYAMELCAWWGQEYAQGYRAVIMPWATKGFWWELQTSWGTSVAEGEADALIDASNALIKAVAERVGVKL